MRPLRVNQVRACACVCVLGGVFICYRSKFRSREPFGAPDTSGETVSTTSCTLKQLTSRLIVAINLNQSAAVHNGVGQNSETM